MWLLDRLITHQTVHLHLWTNADAFRAISLAQPLGVAPRQLILSQYVWPERRYRECRCGFLLVCHQQLADDLVHNMLKIFFESLPDLAQPRPELGVITFQQSPGVPIPLHPGAAAFYRERELFR